MSSFEANTYTAKPSVQVGNTITVTKPIIASNLLIKPQPDQYSHINPQHKKIQPLPKTIRENHNPASKPKPKAGSPAIFQLKSLHKAPPASINADYSRVEVTRKTTFESVTIKGKELSQKQGPQAQKRILAVQPKAEFAMGNEHQRMSSPSPGMSGGPTPESGGLSGALPSASHINSHIPLPVANLNAISPPHNINPRMASIINAQGDARGNNTPSPPMPTISTGPRVVSTSSSKTITGGGTITGPVIQQISHRNTATFGGRTAVIQSASGVRGQQPIIRSATPPVRTVTTANRPINPNLAPAGTHQSQNPTTVQITIHQPKHTVSNAAGGTDRLLTNTLHTATTAHFGNSALPYSTPLPVAGSAPSLGTQQSLQRLVISQGPSGMIQQNKTTVPFVNHEPSRIIAAQSPSQTTIKKSVRAPGPTSQHDYIKSDSMPISGASIRKPGVVDSSNFMTSRHGVSIHTITDHKPTVSGGYFSSGSSSSVIDGGNFHPTTINNLDQHPGVFKTHNYMTPTIISTSSRSGSTVVMGDNSSQDSNGSSGYSLSRPAGVSPSILRKRTHDSSTAVVVKKISQPSDRLTNFGDKSVISDPASPSRHHLTSSTTLERDNGSQSSTDTAMSSESPNQTNIKHEPVEAVENGAAEPQPPDVSPRKKPRKQLLNTAAQLKDRHDSSTEEETETKRGGTPLTIPDEFKCEFDNAQPSTLKDKDGFTDLNGVRWVNMRRRNADPLLIQYNCTWHARGHHFQRYSDVKAKEERRPVVSELSNQKGIHQKASGWKFYHLSAQFQEMIDTEQTLNLRMGRLQKLLPSKIKEKHPELFKINELAQANKQRCCLARDQLQEAKASMFSILEAHQPKIMEIIQKNHSKRPVKKKERP